MHGHATARGRATLATNMRCARRVRQDAGGLPLDCTRQAQAPGAGNAARSRPVKVTDYADATIAAAFRGRYA